MGLSRIMWGLGVCLCVCARAQACAHVLEWMRENLGSWCGYETGWTLKGHMPFHQLLINQGSSQPQINPISSP